MPAYTSPDVRNISVGTGYHRVQAGRCRPITITSATCRASSSRCGPRRSITITPVNGIRVKDYSWTIELNAEIEIEMEEITAQNLQMLMLGDITSDGGRLRSASRRELRRAARCNTPPPTRSGRAGSSICCRSRSTMTASTTRSPARRLQQDLDHGLGSGGERHLRRDDADSKLPRNPAISKET